MGCSSSAQKDATNENAWKDVSQTQTRTKDAPSIRSQPIPIKQPPEIKSTTTGTPSPMSTSSISMRNSGSTDRVGSSSLPPTPLGGPLINKKLTLLQTRSLSSSLSIQTSSNSVASTSLSFFPPTPSLDPTILVEVPDDFRRQYKVMSVLAEKDMSSFAFHGTPLADNNNDDDDDDDCDGSPMKGNADITLYKGIDRQKKYAIVEKTRTHVFKHSTMQIEYFNRLDCLRSLNHDCIPTVLDVFDTPQDYTLVIQYGVGKSLAELMSDRGTMSGREPIRALVLALVETLKHMHKRHIAHRHICPDQLIVSRYNHFGNTKDLKVTGLSRVVRVPVAIAVNDGMSAHGSSVGSMTSLKNTESLVTTVCGVPERYLDVFCAPELSEPNHGLAVDLFSLGVVIYTIMRGAIPVTKSDIRIDDLDCSHSVKRILHSLMQVDPSNRMSLSKVERYFSKSFLSETGKEGEGEGGSEGGVVCSTPGKKSVTRAGSNLSETSDSLSAFSDSGDSAISSIALPCRTTHDKDVEMAMERAQAQSQKMLLETDAD